MGRTALLLIAAGALAGCGSSSASSSLGASATLTARAHSAHCGPASAPTLARGSLTRVYVQRGTVSACLAGRRLPVTLGTRAGCLRGGHVDRVAVAGGLVAAALMRCGVDTGAAEIVVVRVSDGQRLVATPAIGKPGPESYSRVTGLVLTPAGVAAWIARASSIVSHRSVIELRATTGGSSRVLDSGTQIATGSLRLSGATVTWRSGSAHRSARL